MSAWCPASLGGRCSSHLGLPHGAMLLCDLGGHAPAPPWIQSISRSASWLSWPMTWPAPAAIWPQPVAEVWEVWQPASASVPRATSARTKRFMDVLRKVAAGPAAAGCIAGPVFGMPAGDE